MGESPLFRWVDFLERSDAATQTQIAENMALDLEKVRQIAERVAGAVEYGCSLGAGRAKS